MNAPKVPKAKAPRKKAKSPLKYTDAKILVALKDNAGHVGATAAQLGMRPSSLSIRLSKSVFLREAREKIVCDITEVARMYVHDAILDGDISSCKWWLDRTMFREAHTPAFLPPPPPIGNPPQCAKP